MVNLAKKEMSGIGILMLFLLLLECGYELLFVNEMRDLYHWLLNVRHRDISK